MHIFLYRSIWFFLQTNLALPQYKLCFAFKLLIEKATETHTEKQAFCRRGNSGLGANKTRVLVIPTYTCSSCLPNVWIHLLLRCTFVPTWRMLWIYMAHRNQQKPEIWITKEVPLWPQYFHGMVQIWTSCWDQIADIMCTWIQMWNACHRLDEWYSPYSFSRQGHQGSVLHLFWWLLCLVK